MDKLEYKKSVLQEAKKRQLTLINDFKSKIEELKAPQTDPNTDQSDRDKPAVDASTNEIIGKMAEELNFCVDEMRFLETLEAQMEIKETAELGSIVKTDKGMFFPSVSIEKFQVGNDELFGLSAMAPLFKEMRGKKKGDSFSYNERSYKIQDVF